MFKHLTPCCPGVRVHNGNTRAAGRERPKPALSHLLLHLRKRWTGQKRFHSSCTPVCWPQPFSHLKNKPIFQADSPQKRVFSKELRHGETWTFHNQRAVTKKKRPTQGTTARQFRPYRRKSCVYAAWSVVLSGRWHAGTNKKVRPGKERYQRAAVHVTTAVCDVCVGRKQTTLRARSAVDFELHRKVSISSSYYL